MTSVHPAAALYARLNVLLYNTAYQGEEEIKALSVR
jgi:hypothetical protein